MECLQNRIKTLTDEQISNVNAFITRLQDQKKLTISERYSLFPIEDNLAWDFYLAQLSQHWIATEVDIERDVKQINENKVKPSQIELLKKIVAFFVSADGGIADNATSLAVDCTSREESFYLTVVAHIENIHNHFYNLWARKIFNTPEIYNQVMTMANSNSCQHMKMNYIEKYKDGDQPRILRYVASCCMEGTFFMGLFPIIFYFISKDLFPGFTQGNQLIFRDETLHYEYYLKRVKQELEINPNMKDIYAEDIHKIVLEAEEIEKEFIKELLQQPVMPDGCDLKEGLTVENLFIQIEMITDRTLKAFGYKEVHGNKVELPWMSLCSLVNLTNKYDKKVTEYRGMSGNVYQRSLEDSKIRLKSKKIKI